MKLINNPTETQSHCINVNGVCQITTESIKLVLNIEHFGAGSDLVVPTQGSTAGTLLFNTSLLVMTFDGFHRNACAIEYFSSYILSTIKSEASTNNFMLLATRICSTSFGFKW